MTASPDTPRNWRSLATYACAQLGGSVFLHLPAMLLMPFLTNALAVPAAIAGMVIFLPKFWVVLFDPLIGVISDKLKARGIGRAKLAFGGGIAMAFLLPLLFAPVLLPEPWMRALFVLIAYLIGSTAFSAFSVPYLILASEVAEADRDRTTLLSMRQVANYSGALLVNYAPALVHVFGAGREAYGKMGMIFGAVCLVTTFSLWPFRRMATAPVEQGATVGMGGLAPFLALAAHRRFRALLAAYAMQMAAVGVISASFLYYVVYCLQGDLVLVSTIATCLTIAGILAQPVWVAIERRIGALQTYALAVAGMACSDFGYVLLNPGNNAQAFALAAVVGIFSSGFSVMAWTLLLALMTEARLGQGGPQEGTYAGVWSAIEKVAMAAGALIGGFALQLTGFRSSTSGFIAQSDAAIFGVRLVTGGLTSALLVGSLVFLLIYRRAHIAR